MGQGNSGWCKLVQHGYKKALTWFDEIQVDALVRDSWGDIGHLTVFVRRDDAPADRRWTATVFDHDNRVLVTAHAATKSAADEQALDAIVALKYSPTGYRSKMGKAVRDDSVRQVDTAIGLKDLEAAA